MPSEEERNEMKLPVVDREISKLDIEVMASNVLVSLASSNVCRPWQHLLAMTVGTVQAVDHFYLRHRQN
jgi:hypothetical protein